MLAGAGCKNDNWNELLYQTLPKYNSQSTPIFKPLSSITGEKEFTPSCPLDCEPQCAELREARISDKSKDLNSGNKCNSFDLKSHGAQ